MHALAAVLLAGVVCTLPSHQVAAGSSPARAEQRAVWLCGCAESGGSAEETSECEEELGDGREAAAAAKRARVAVGASEAAAARSSEPNPVLSNAADDTSYRGSADTLHPGAAQQVVEQRQQHAAASVAAEHAAAPAAAADTAVSVKQEDSKGEESGSGQPLDMAQALAVQMDLQRQLQEALEVRAAQLKAACWVVHATTPALRLLSFMPFVDV